jgi:hypothetical protein
MLMEVKGRGRDSMRGREDLEDSQASVLCSGREVVEAEVKAVRLSAVDLPLVAEAKLRSRQSELFPPPPTSPFSRPPSRSVSGTSGCVAFHLRLRAASSFLTCCT